MGRLKTFDRDEAVRKAMLELWKHGYESCSVKYLSETLGLTRSSFYNAFGSREALFLEALHVYFDQSPDRALEQIDPEKDVLVSICELFKSVCEIRATDIDHKGCMAVNSVIGLVGINKKVGPVLSDAVLKSVERFESLLKVAAERGEIDRENIKDKAVALQNLLVGINVLCRVVHNVDTLWHSIRVTLLGLGVYKTSFRL